MRFILFLIFAIASTNLFAGSSEENSLTLIKTKGVLNLSIYGKDSPPFLMKNNKTGKWTGFDIDLAKLLAKKLNVKLNIDDKSKTFDEVISSVESARSDLAISKLSLTSSRAQKILFSSPYVRLKVGVAYNRMNLLKLEKRKPKSSDAFQISGVRAGVLKGSSYVDYLKSRFPNAKLVYFQNRDEIYKKLASGNIDFTLADETTLETWRYSYPALNLKINLRMLPRVSDPIGIAVNWKKRMLVDWLNVLLEELRSTGELKVLKNKYFEEDSWRAIK